MKKLIKSFGVLALLGTAVGSMAFAGTALAAGKDDAKKYTDPSQFVVDEKGIVTAYNGKDTEVVIPSVIETAGTTVTVTGLSGTFKGNTTVKNVIIPDTIKSIGDETFSGCEGLNSVDVYDLDSVVDTSEFTEWTDYSKYLYDAKTDVLYNITDMGSNVVIPQAVTAIGEQVFNDCNFVGFYVMDGNTAFKDSDEGGMNQPEGIGGSLLSIDGKLMYKLAPCFRDLANSTTYKIPSGVEEIKSYALYKSSNGGMQNIEVADTVKHIDAYAFYKSGMLNVTFGENSLCEVIGEYAFAYNDNLDIKLPKSVKKIYSYALAYIVNRTPDISGSSIETIEPYIFYGCANLHTVTMPETLKSIEGYAFAGCDNLNEILFLGKTLDKIGTGAFKGCPNLHKIKVPEGVKSIENDTFSGCQNLNEIILPESLEKIGDGAFENCQNIHVLVIPENVKYISNTSFKGAKTDEIDTSKNKYANNRINSFNKGRFKYLITSFDKNTGKGTVAVTGVSKSKYKNTKKLTVPSTVKFGNNEYTVTKVKKNAFKGFKKLKKVVLGKNIATIESGAFSKCRALVNIKLPSSVKKIGANAFSGCSSLTKITIPSRVKQIAAGTFNGCKKLKTVKLGKRVTNIGASAFKNCKALTAITLPSKVTKIGNYAFKGCSRLKTLTIKSTKIKSKGISKSAFKGMSKKTKIKVPKTKVKSYKAMFKKKGLSSRNKVTK